MRSEVQVFPGPPFLAAGKAPAACGAVAQLGERLLCKQEVVGSIPITSTIRRFEWWNGRRTGQRQDASRNDFASGFALKRSLFVIVKMFDPQSAGTLLGEADCK